MLGRQRVRLLRIYLGATTFLFTYGVVFTLFPVRTDIAYGNPVGGITAIVLGISALVYLAVKPERLLLPTAAAIAATPVVMAFHVSLTAEYVCLIAPDVLGDVHPGVPSEPAGLGPDRRTHRRLRGGRRRRPGAARRPDHFSHHCRRHRRGR
ncbi:MAG: hypothetical protein WBB00_16225 [Mycobacterium sp.]